MLRSRNDGATLDITPADETMVTHSRGAAARRGINTLDDFEGGGKVVLCRLDINASTEPHAALMSELTGCDVGSMDDVCEPAHATLLLSETSGARPRRHDLNRSQ